MIAYQILEGLNYLHKDLKIIHRDIKPGNILVNSNGDIKIGDLGICGKLEHTTDVTNSWVGTTIYMSVLIISINFSLKIHLFKKKTARKTQ